MQTIKHRIGSWSFRSLFSFLSFFFKLPLKKCQSCTQFHIPTKRPLKAEKAIKAWVSDKLSFTLVIRFEIELTYFSKDHKKWPLRLLQKRLLLRKRKTLPACALSNKTTPPCAIVMHDAGYGPEHFIYGSKQFIWRLTLPSSGIPPLGGTSTVRGSGSQSCWPHCPWHPQPAQTSWFWLPACPSCSEYPKSGERLIRAAQRLPRSVLNLGSRHHPFPIWVLDSGILKNLS